MCARMIFTPLNSLLFLMPQDELGKPGAAQKTLPFIPLLPTASKAKRACLLLQTNRIPVLKASQTAKPIFGFLKHKQLGFLKMDTSTVRRCKSIKRKTVEIYNPALILQSLAIQGEKCGPPSIHQCRVINDTYRQRRSVSSDAAAIESRPMCFTRASAMWQAASPIGIRHDEYHKHESLLPQTSTKERPEISL